MQRPIEGAIHRVNFVNAFNGLTTLFACLKMHRHLNTFDHEDSLFLLHLTCHVCLQLPIARIDFARFQRAPEGSHHSTSDTSYYVVNGRGVRLLDTVGGHLVVFRDCSMNAKYHRLRLARKICDAKGSYFALDPNV